MQRRKVGDTVQRFGYDRGAACVAEQALGCDRPVEIGLAIVFIAGRHIPKTAIRIIPDRRLVQIAIVNESVTATHAPGADKEVQRLAMSIPFELQPASGFGNSHNECRTLDGRIRPSVRRRRLLARSIRHRACSVTRHNSGVALAQTIIAMIASSIEALAHQLEYCHRSFANLGTRGNPSAAGTYLHPGRDLASLGFSFAARPGGAGWPPSAAATSKPPKVNSKRPPELEPASARVWKLLGMTYIAQEKYEAAEESCRRACDVDPHEENACYYWGHVDFTLGRFHQPLSKPIKKRWRTAWMPDVSCSGWRYLRSDVAAGRRRAVLQACDRRRRGARENRLRLVFV